MTTINDTATTGVWCIACNVTTHTFLTCTRYKPRVAPHNERSQPHHVDKTPKPASISVSNLNGVIRSRQRPPRNVAAFESRVVCKFCGETGHRTDKCSSEYNAENITHRFSYGNE